MKRSICVLVVCFLIFFSVSAFAAELPTVSVNGNIEMSKISYDNLLEGELIEGSDLTITMNAKAKVATDDTYIFVATLYDNGEMIDMDSDPKPISTELTAFEVTLEQLPEDVTECEITVALLMATETGFIPVSKASYCPADEEFLSLLSIKVDGEEVAFDEYNEASIELAPDENTTSHVVNVQTAEAATAVDIIADESGNQYITATLPSGALVEYVITFTVSKHVIEGALSETDFTEQGPTTNFPHSKMSSSEVLIAAFEGGNANNSSGIGASYKNYYRRAFANLSGINIEKGIHYGSRWTTDYDSHQVHSLFYVDPSLEGCDYFVTKNSTVSAGPTDKFFEFNIAYDAEVIVLTFAPVNNLTSKDGWTATTHSSPIVKASFIQDSFGKTFKSLTGYNMNRPEADLWNEKASQMTYTEADGGNDAYMEACADVAASLTERTGDYFTAGDIVGLPATNAGGGVMNYSYSYSKEFRLADGETSKTVTIYGPDTKQNRGYIVVVKSLED